MRLKSKNCHQMVRPDTDKEPDNLFACRVLKPSQPVDWPVTTLNLFYTKRPLEFLSTTFQERKTCPHDPSVGTCRLADGGGGELHLWMEMGRWYVPREEKLTSPQSLQTLTLKGCCDS